MVISNGKCKRDIQFNGKNQKGQTTIYKSTQKTKDRATQTPLKLGMISGASKR